jgi:hypothetical protein
MAFGSCHLLLHASWRQICSENNYSPQLPHLYIHGTRAGLPDGFFSDQKSQFGCILENPGMENVVIYSGHLENFTTIGYILRAFGNFVVIFPPLWYIVLRKIWQPWTRAGWPDEFVKKMWPKPTKFDKVKAQLLPWKKGLKKFCLRLFFSKNGPK